MLNLSKLMSLKDRRALITGGNGHIGRIIALTLAELGADLIFSRSSRIKLQKLTTEITNNFKVDIRTYDCDLGIENDRKKLISTLCNENTSLNILVNNAAFVGDTNLEGWATDFDKQSVETWRSALEVNLTAAFSLIQGLSPLLQKAKEQMLLILVQPMDLGGLIIDFTKEHQWETQQHMLHRKVG